MAAHVDLLISGCNTHCKHCYVNGGPGKTMPLDDALLCISKLNELAAALPFACSFTLDNEPINHPDIAEIVRAASSTRHIEHFHHGMTTGIALMQRTDKEAVVQTYLDCRCKWFGITLHGAPARHDEIVRRKGSFHTTVEAAEFLKKSGANVQISLMFNRYFSQNAAAIDETIRRVEPDDICFAIPNYTPHANMPDFESDRAGLNDLEACLLWLVRWRQDETKLMQQAKQGLVAAVIERLERGLRVSELFRQPQNELYCTVHQDCKLYIGNTGVETECLGDLRSLDIAQAAERLQASPGNRDYSAFYNLDQLPTEEELIRALKKLPPDRLYADLPSVIYRGLAELHVPTRII